MIPAHQFCDFFPFSSLFLAFNPQKMVKNWIFLFFPISIVKIGDFLHIYVF